MDPLKFYLHYKLVICLVDTTDFIGEREKDKRKKNKREQFNSISEQLPYFPHSLWPISKCQRRCRALCYGHSAQLCVNRSCCLSCLSFVKNVLRFCCNFLTIRCKEAFIKIQKSYVRTNSPKRILSK
jgi:hypothetical protein